MATSYEKSQAADETVQRMLGDSQYTEFNPLRDQDIKLVGILKTTTKGKDESEETVPGKKEVEVKKVSDLYQCVVDAHYLVVIDAYFWQNAETRVKNARLHRALMSIEVGEDGKLKSRAPDVVEYRATLVRFGQYTEELTSLAEVLQGAVQAAASHVAARLGTPLIVPQTVRPTARGRRAPRGASAVRDDATGDEDRFASALHEQVTSQHPEVGIGEEE